MKKILTLIAALIFFSLQTYSQQCWCSFLLDYTASLQSNGSMRISWRTDTESSLAKDFIVQRSPDAVSFSDIGYISANAGATSFNYSFIDPYPCGPGNNVYYRLKSVNLSGNIRYSSIIQKAKSCPSTCSSNPNTCKCNLNNLAGPNPATICSGGQVIYEVTNASGPVTWTVDDPSKVTLSPVTSTRVIVAHNGYNGSATLTATINGCTAFTRQLTLGITQPTGLNRSEIACIGGSEYEYNLYAFPSIPNTNYLWTITVTANGYTYSNDFTSVGSTFWGYEPGLSNSAIIDVQMKMQNSCGTSATQPFTYSFSPTICYDGFRIKMKPNPPTNGILHVEIIDEATKPNFKKENEQTPSQTDVLIYKLDDNTFVKAFKFPESQKIFTLYLPNLAGGKYILKIIKGGQTKSGLFVIQ